MTIRNTDTMPFTHRISREPEAVCNCARSPRQADYVMCRDHDLIMRNLIPDFKPNFSIPDGISSRHDAAMQEWSKRLDRRRKDLGWSQAELARRADLSIDNVRKYCQGRVDQPRGATIDALAEAMEVTSQWLRDGTSPTDSPQNEQERIWLELYRKLSPEARKALMAAGHSLAQPLDDDSGNAGGGAKKAS